MTVGELDGWNVVVTRSEGPGGPLGARLEARGARVMLLPSVTIGPPDDPAALEAACERLGDFDYVVFTSRRAVDAVQRALADWLPSCVIAVVGAGTAEAVRSLGWPVQIEGPGGGAAELARAMVRAGVGRGSRVLFLSSGLAGTALPDALRVAGAQVEQVEAYTSRPVAPPIESESGLTLANAVTFTSPSSVDGWRLAVGADLRGPLDERAHLVAIGPTTRSRINEYGAAAHAPRESTFGGLVECLCRLHREARP